VSRDATCPNGETPEKQAKKLISNGENGNYARYICDKCVVKCKALITPQEKAE
jgi:hypothetical protein